MNLPRHDITERIIRHFYAVYNDLGHGFLESVYENALALALRDDGLTVEQQHPIAVHFRGCTVGDFRADLLVEGTVLVELKAASAIEPTHLAQLINYLRATDVEVGLLLNFGPKAHLKRLLYTNERKTALTAPAYAEP